MSGLNNQRLFLGKFFEVLFYQSILHPVLADLSGFTVSADLQSGKAVLVEGIKGYDGKTISQYVKANFNQGRLDFYNENPDRKRDASQRNVVANAQKQGQEQAGRKSKGASIA